MSKIVRYEFLGSWLKFWVLCVLIFTIPLAILYLIDGTVRLDSEVEDPEKFVQAFRSRILEKKATLSTILWELLVAIAVGNAVYFSVAARAGFSLEGLGIDFFICLVMFVIVHFAWSRL